MIRAATGSDHHHPVAAFKIKPTNKMAERYVQKSACLASANIAALPSCSPTRFFAWERRGIATKAAQATTIPAMLCAGACLRHRLEIATEATYRESTRKQIPTILRVNRSFCSRLSSSAISDKRHSKATAEVTSIKLSTPKPTREILPEMNPVANAANPSRLFHPIVKYSRRLPRCAMMANSGVSGGTAHFISILVVNLMFTLIVLHLNLQAGCAAHIPGSGR